MSEGPNYLSPDDAAAAYRYAELLDHCENFGDIFDLVKRTVKKALRRERAGLMLVLADLPLNLGAFHGVGGNSVVMNRSLLDLVVGSGIPRREINSFVYNILLHEYLHSLGYLDEAQVRKMTYRVSKEIFGDAHPATVVALRGPWSILPDHLKGAAMKGRGESSPELITDFDRSHRSYIS